MPDIEMQLRTLINDPNEFLILELILKILCSQDNRIDFEQKKLVESSEFTAFSHLQNFVLRFNGLCELISNAVIAEDMLGHRDTAFRDKLSKYNGSFFDLQEQPSDPILSMFHQAIQNAHKNPLERKISLKNIDRFTSTHTLDVTSYFQQIIAYFYGIYPFDIFPQGAPLVIDQSINQPLLEERLNQLSDGFYIKFMAFRKGWLSFVGHTMNIKKTGNTFSFFDPNEGETYDLDINELCFKINRAMKNFLATDVAFFDGAQFLKYLTFQRDPHANFEESYEPNVEFILSTLEEVAHAEIINDETLVNIMAELRAKMERHYPAYGDHAPQMTLAPSLCSAAYFRVSTEMNLDTLDQIRFEASKNQWKKQLRGKMLDLVQCNYSFQSARETFFTDELGNDFLFFSLYENRIYYGNQQTSIIEIITEEMPEYYQLKPFFKEIGTTFASEKTRLAIIEVLGLPSTTSLSIEYHILSQTSLLNTPYNVSAVIDMVPYDMRDQLITELDFTTVIKTSRDAYLLFKFVNAQTKQHLFNILKYHLVELIKTAYDVKRMFSVLGTQSQREELFDLLEKLLPNYLNTIGDLGEMFKFFKHEQRAKIFNLIKHRLQEITEDATGYGFQSALEVLVSEQSSMVADAMLRRAQEKLIFIENDITLLKILMVLSTEQNKIFIHALFEQNLSLLSTIRAPAAFFGNELLIKIITLLTDEHWMNICKTLLDVNPRWIASGLVLCSMLLELDEHTPTKGLILLDFLEVHLPQILPNVIEFTKVFNSDCGTKLPRIYRDIIYNVMKDHLVDLVTNELDLRAMMAVLTRVQRSVLQEPKCIDILAEHFTKFLSLADAKRISGAIISQNADEICYLLSTLCARKPDNGWERWGLWRENATSPLMQAFNNLDIFWQSMIIEALNLGDFAKEDFSLALNQYLQKCASRQYVNDLPSFQLASSVFLS